MWDVSWSWIIITVIDWLSKAERPTKHIIGHIEDRFLRVKWPVITCLHGRQWVPVITLLLHTYTQHLLRTLSGNDSSSINAPSASCSRLSGTLLHGMYVAPSSTSHRSLNSDCFTPTSSAHATYIKILLSTHLSRLQILCKQWC